MAEGEGRVFLRGLTSEQYGLGEQRQRQRAAPRVRRAGTVTDDATVAHSGDEPDHSRTWWVLGPGDEPFLTQTLQAHFVELSPGGRNHGHGHQNEALFYILEGKGYEIHDGKRYDWEKGDLVVVHNDSHHQHFNASATERALALVIKAKAAWMYLGLVQQGRAGPAPAGVGPREDWSRLWTPGVQDKKKVVKPADAPWETTRDGKARILSAASRTDLRAHSVDVQEREIPAGSRSAKHWHMADEFVYVISGAGHSLHWDVEAEIDDKYYARIATEPTRWDFRSGDTLYVPQNTVHQHWSEGAEPLRFLSAQNRLFKLLGYDSVVYLEDAPSSMGLETAASAR